ncbi:MAG: hypothetical protein N3D16_02650 [Anaerolineales bacterium]|nr:hypothetical protein [Anaerolineales bacterium]
MSRHLGLQKTCLSFGAPQPKNVALHLPEKQEMVSNEGKIAEVRKVEDTLYL